MSLFNILVSDVGIGGGMIHGEKGRRGECRHTCKGGDEVQNSFVRHRATLGFQYSLDVTNNIKCE